jgi:hypothetical protein
VKPSRRGFLASAGAGLAWLPLGPTLARGERLIPQKASLRVIVDNDFAGDPDGLAALAHQLLSPKSRVTLVTASGLNPKFVEAALAGRSAEAGRTVALELIRRLDSETVPPVSAGSEAMSLESSPAARAIVAEAMRDDPLPLYLTCGGPLTNVATALRLEPAIAARMTVVWIGGGGYPAGGWEYNLATDEAAAREVIEQSHVPLWQIPQPAYRQAQFSIAEMTADLRPLSPFSRWLYERFTDPPDFLDLSGAWPLGDSPLVLLTALSSESSRYAERPARKIGSNGTYGEEVPGRTVRIYEQIDTRLMFADFLAQLRLHAAR